MNEDENEDLAAQPHDAFFKDFFSDVGHAKTFFQGHLPENIAAVVQWDSLALKPGSFVSTSLKQSHSDLLFSALREGGEELLLYLLFEHQTKVDRAMPLRLLRYVTEIWTMHEAELGLPLPPVVSYVLHQGPGEWTVSQKFEDLFEIPDGEQDVLLEYLPKFRHVLLDLSRADPGSSESDPEIRVTLQLMKLARQKRLVEFFDWLLATLEESEDPLPGELLRKSLLYAFHGDQTIDVETISHTLETSPDPQSAIMSLSEQLMARGEAIGEARGKVIGEAHGLWLGKVQVLEGLIGCATPLGNLEAMSNSDLEKRYHELEQLYKTKFR